MSDEKVISMVGHHHEKRRAKERSDRGAVIRRLFMDLIYAGSVGLEIKSYHPEVYLPEHLLTPWGRDRDGCVRLRLGHTVVAGGGVREHGLDLVNGTCSDPITGRQIPCDILIPWEAIVRMESEALDLVFEVGVGVALHNRRRR